jgi:hypothetical protein
MGFLKIGGYLREGITKGFCAIIFILNAPIYTPDGRSDIPV